MQLEFVNVSDLSDSIQMKIAKTIHALAEAMQNKQLSVSSDTIFKKIHNPNEEVNGKIYLEI
jgi:hypothetical protein